MCLTWHLLTANPVTLVTDRLGIKVRSQRSGGSVPRAAPCNLIGSRPRLCTHHRKLNYRDCHPESRTAHLSCLNPSISPFLLSFTSHFWLSALPLILLSCLLSSILFACIVVAHFLQSGKRKEWVANQLNNFIAVPECRYELKEYPKSNILSFFFSLI